MLDVDEEALRRARVEPRLFGTLAVPYRPGRTQARKAATPADEQAAVLAAARGAASAHATRRALPARPGRHDGGARPGARRREDAARRRRRARRAASCSPARPSASCSTRSRAGPAQAVVTVIGGQGFLLGRGNQQLSARVLRALGDDPLLVVAPEQKLIDLGGRPLLVDTGDADVDAALAGFVRVDHRPRHHQHLPCPRTGTRRRRPCALRTSRPSSPAAPAASAAPRRSRSPQRARPSRSST